MSPDLEATIERLRQAGCVFPVSVDDLMEHRVFDSGRVRGLARKGLIQNSELYDSDLPRSCLFALENWGVKSRAHFRSLYHAGQIDMNSARGVGSGRAVLILRWAGLRPPANAKEPVTLHLSVAACEGLQQLKKHMDLPTRDLVLECLIAEAVRAIGAEADSQTQRPPPAPPKIAQ